MLASGSKNKSRDCPFPNRINAELIVPVPFISKPIGQVQESALANHQQETRQLRINCTCPKYLFSALPHLFHSETVSMVWSACSVGPLFDDFSILHDDDADARLPGSLSCLLGGALQGDFGIDQVGIAFLLFFGNIYFPCAHGFSPSSIRIGVAKELSYSAHSFTRGL